MTATASVPRGSKNGTMPDVVLDRDREAPVGATGEILQVPLELIDVDANIRINVASIEELAASIAAHGVRQPISVRDVPGDRFAINFGQRRYLASKMAGKATIPAFVDNEARTAEQLAIHQLVENLAREDLPPLDRARAMRTVVDAGMSQAELARQLGMGASTVTNDLGLLEAPPAIQELIESAKLTPAHAKAIKGLSADVQVRLAKIAVASSDSAHELERNAKYAREDEQRQERDRSRLEKVAKSAIEQLEKSVAKDALIVVTGAVVRNAIKKAGWTNLHEGDRWAVDVVKKAGECGCATWLVDYVGDTRFAVQGFTYPGHATRESATVHLHSGQAKRDLELPFTAFGWDRSEKVWRAEQATPA